MSDSSGVMEQGLINPTTGGTPQGGPLPTLLSNVYLDDLEAQSEQGKERGDAPFPHELPWFSFTTGKNPERRIAPKAIDRFKKRVRESTRRTRGISLEAMIVELDRYLRGDGGAASPSVRYRRSRAALARGYGESCAHSSGS